MDVSVPLSEVEIDELAEFLISDETPEECMDISMLDGFLTGLVIGPDTILPSRWLPVVWGETEQDKIVWESKEKMERIIGLVMRLYNSVAQKCRYPGLLSVRRSAEMNPVHVAAGRNTRSAVGPLSL